MTFLNITLSAAIVATLGWAAPAQAADSSKGRADFASCAKPNYPAESLAAKHEGTVTLSFLVGVDGAVTDTRILKSSGQDLLDASARDAIKLCKFIPTTRDGVKVQDWVNVQYVWTLK